MPLLAGTEPCVIALDPAQDGRFRPAASGYEMHTVAAELHGFVEALGLTTNRRVDIASATTSAPRSVIFMPPNGGMM